jgi:hypothetical protein
MRQTIAILFSFAVGLHAINLECKFEDRDWGTVKGTVCIASNVNITSRQTVTSVNGQSNFDGSNYKMIDIQNQVVNFIPEGLEKFFPNIEGLSITASKLKRVGKKDMQQFPKLKILYLSSNDLEFLPSDLFEGNLELRSFAVFANPFTHFGHKLVTPLQKLEAAIFPYGSCVKQFYFRSKIPSIGDDLRANCTEPTQEMIGEARDTT